MSVRGASIRTARLRSNIVQKSSLYPQIPSLLATCAPRASIVNSPRARRRDVIPHHARLLHSDTEDTRVPHDDGEPATELEHELLAIQDAAIAELEAKLGKSLQEAIEEDILAAKGFDDSVIRAIAREQKYSAQYESAEQDGPAQGDEHVPEVLVEAAEDPLVLLRRDGASEEAIAREARQIFGDVLPEETLTPAERNVYVRFYGEPAEPMVEGIEDGEDVDADEMPQHVLIDAAGSEVEYSLESSQEVLDRIMKQQEEVNDVVDVVATKQPTSGTLHTLSTGMLADLNSRAQDIAKSLEGSTYMEEDYDVDEGGEDLDEPATDMRSHPLTRLGKFGTRPNTVFLPQEGYVQPVQKIMSDFSNKHLKEVCEKAFGGPGLPDSPLTPRSGRSREQVPVPLDVNQHTMSQMEANAFITTVMPPVYASVLSTLVETRKRLGAAWLNKLLARPGGPKVLDVGAGGAGILAWREMVDAHWTSLYRSDKEAPPTPSSKSVVLTSADTLRHRSAALLENTTFIPRLPDYVNSRGMPTLEDQRPAQQRKQFDVIIASHSLFQLKEDWERKQQVQNLWSLLSPEGGVLIIIEKGIPRGFEAVAAARELLLERYIATPEGHETHYSVHGNPDFVDGDSIHQKLPGMIVAPCTNHSKCPLYRVPGISKGRKDVCSFQQRYIRPPFLQRVLGAKDRNHDDVDFSYISVMKGDDLRLRDIDTWERVDDPMSAPIAKKPSQNPSAQDTQEWMSTIQSGFGHHIPPEEIASTESSDKTSEAPPPSHTLPRVLMPPLKRRGHVTFDLCTPAATIERWTIPKSFSKQAYRDARKARWGDLWALGAKTSVPRNLRLGVTERDLDKKLSGQKSGKRVALSGEERRALGRKEKSFLDAEKILDQGHMEREGSPARRSRDEDEDAVDELDDEDDDLLDPDTLLPRRASKKAASSAEWQPMQPPAPEAPARRIGEEDPLERFEASLNEFSKNRDTRAGSGKYAGQYVSGRYIASRQAKRDQKRASRGSR